MAASALMSAIRSWLMRKTKRRLAICREEAGGERDWTPEPPLSPPRDP